MGDDAMICIMLVIMLATAQANDSQWICGGTKSVQNCRRADGSTYIERRIGSRLVRKGTTSDGQSWIEYVSKNLEGWRLQGEDSEGGRWFQRCNPQSGINGTDRGGRTVSRPPGPEGCAL